MHPKLCLLSSPARDILQQIKFAGENRFQGIEISIEYPYSTPDILLDCRNRILDQMECYDLIGLAHAQSLIEPCHVYPGIREAGIKELLRALEAAYRLEIGFITLHPGSTPSWFCPRIESLNLSLEMLKIALRYAEERGLSLGIENLPPKPHSRYFFHTRDFSWILERLDGICMVLDAAHAHMGGKHLPLRFLNKFLPKLSHIHISDNLGGEDLHLPLGAGNLDYEKFMRSLISKGYGKTISLEIFTREPEYILVSKRILENILSS